MLRFSWILRFLIVVLMVLTFATLARWAYQGSLGNYGPRALAAQQARITLKETKKQALTQDVHALERQLTNLQNNDPETIEHLLRSELGFTLPEETKVQLVPLPPAAPTPR